MASKDPWSRFRSLYFSRPDLGFALDLSKTGLDTDTIRESESKLRRALDAMKRLEQGAIANPDEERMVGHYWLRKPELAPKAEVADEIRATVDRVVDFAARVYRAEIRPTHARRFENLLVIGIGGSALGPQLVADALGRPDDHLSPHFFDNTDPDGIDRVLDGLGENLKTTLAIVISKSGGTPETRNGMLEAAAGYRSLGLEFGPHAVAVTQDGSKLDTFAFENGFIGRFPMWDWIGGRTSETSAVGLLPAALQGIDVRAMLDGAARMDEWTRSIAITNNPAALLALAWYHEGDGRGLKDMVILPYKDRLALFSRYLQQLVMESLGKEKDLDGKTVHQGIAVYGNKGSTDQHAYVQQLRDGIANFFVTFIEVLRDREGPSIEVEDGATSGDFLHGFLLGTRRALHENGRQSITITVRDVSPGTIGMLIALYERAVGLYASLVNVNAYHQPGVEAGKKAAAEVLELQRKLVAAVRKSGSRGATCDELADAAGAAKQVETAFKILERLAANPERDIESLTGDSPFNAIYRQKKGD